VAILQHKRRALGSAASIQMISVQQLSAKVPFISYFTTVFTVE
jgi:hypothetical protein